jgi:hypothetical protein
LCHTKRKVISTLGQGLRVIDTASSVLTESLELILARKDWWSMRLEEHRLGKLVRSFIALFTEQTLWILKFLIKKFEQIVNKHSK